jgi:proteasome lid subunit RPN8/RPN11
MLILPPNILAQLQHHAAAEYPRECCGILLGRTHSGRVETLHALPAKNLADPARLHDRYTIDPLAVLHADRQASQLALDIIGFYHSHPDHPATPSPTDLAAAWPHYVYLILTVAGASRPCSFPETSAWQLPFDGPPMRELAIHDCIPPALP